jgi:hypothetical protein
MEILTTLMFGYSLAVAVEASVLLGGLSPLHPWRHRLFAGLWLTACTYPIVMLVLPSLLYEPHQRWLYVTVAEGFAATAECILFWAAFDRGRSTWPSRCRDWTVIVLANLASFVAGEVWRLLNSV